MDLYRREAVRAHRQDWLGGVDLTRSPMAWPMALLATAFTIAMVLFAVFGETTRSERVRGQLVPTDGLISVLSTDAGVVTRVLVGEGDVVAQGQALAEISTERDAVGLRGRGLGATVRAELERQHARLSADLRELDVAESARRQQLDQQIELLRGRLGLLDAQRALKERQHAGALQLNERVRSLAPGVLTALQLQQHEVTALAAEAELNGVLLQQLEARSALTAAIEERGRASQPLAERRSGIEQSLAEISQAMARNESAHSVVLRASRDGVVSGLAVSVGQAVAIGRRVMSLLPGGSKLQGELWVPTRAVGLLATDTRVAMRYHAFPYQTFGHQRGRVIAVADAALTPEEIRAVAGVDVPVSSFRVLVELERQQLSLAGRPLALRVGMSLEADLLLDRGPLYRAVLAPAPDLASATRPAAPLSLADVRR